MSISDIIVVMKDGVKQQVGAPQEVYDDPANLFVAQFLGTPPINVFDGRLDGGKLFVNGDAVMEVPSLAGETREVAVGIRPEAFVPDDSGPMSCKLSSLEVMGRDCSVVFTNDASRKPISRAIVNSDVPVVPDAAGIVRFTLKPHKVFLFDAESGERIRF